MKMTATGFPVKLVNIHKRLVIYTIIQLITFTLLLLIGVPKLGPLNIEAGNITVSDILARDAALSILFVISVMLFDHGCSMTGTAYDIEAQAPGRKYLLLSLVSTISKFQVFGLFSVVLIRVNGPTRVHALHVGSAIIVFLFSWIKSLILFLHRYGDDTFVISYFNLFFLVMFLAVGVAFAFSSSGIAEWVMVYLIILENVFEAQYFNNNGTLEQSVRDARWLGVDTGETVRLIAK